MRRGEVKVETPERIALSTVGADIEISPHVEGTKIEYEVYGGGEHYEPKVSVSGSEVMVDFESKEKKLFGLINVNRSPIDRVVVRLPKRPRHLKVRTVSGEIKVSSVEPAVLTLSSVSGSLVLNDVVSSKMSASVISGDFSMRDSIVEDELSLSSVSGDCSISLKETLPKRAQIATTSGDIRVEAEEIPSLEVKVSSLSGDFVHDLELEKVGKGLYRSSETPDCTLQISTISGDVELRRRLTDVKTEAIQEEIEGEEYALNEELERIKRMLEEGILDCKQAVEILRALGYTEEEISDSLKECEDV